MTRPALPTGPRRPWSIPRRSLRTCLCWLAACALAWAQDPPRQDPEKQDPEKQPKPAAGTTQDPTRREEVDPAAAAAEALRRLLRGETTPPTTREELPPNVEVPAGPPPPPPPPVESGAERPAGAGEQDPDTGPEGAPGAAAGTATGAGAAQGADERTTPPQDPVRPPDEVDQARNALERLLPGAAPVNREPEQVRDDPGRAADPALDPARAADSEGAAQDPEAAAAALADRTSGSTEPLAEPAYPIDGFLTLDYRGRHAEDPGAGLDGTSGNTDQDFTAILGVDFGDSRRHDVTAHFLGRGRFDLDGIDTFNPLNGINETYDNGVELHLWDAWVDVHRTPGVELVRIGRQTILDTPRTLFLDGVRVDSQEFAEFRGSVGGFVGLPTRYHSGHDSGEFLSGIWGEARPWDGGRLRTEWVHVDDERDGQEFTDDMVGFSAWQSVGRSTLLHARHNLLDGRSLDVHARVQTDLEDLGLSLQVAYTELLNTQVRQTLEFDPFWNSLFDLNPYRQFSASLTQMLSSQVDLTGGFDVRRLTDTADEGQFNRDYERYYGTITWFDDPEDETVSVSASVDAYRASQGDDVLAIYGDVTWQVATDWETSLGTDYSLYRYDWQFQAERQDIYSAYLRVEHDLAEDWSARVQYRIEDAAGDLFHTFEARVTWTF